MMKVFAFAVLMLFALPTVALAQEIQLDEFEINVHVYSDENTSGDQEIGEDLLAGWTFELYDDTLSLITSEVSVDNQDTVLSTLSQPAYLCLAPQADWIQTDPSFGSVSHPTDIAWYCFDLAQSEAELYQFGVFLPDDGPESNGEVRNDDNTESTEKLVIEDESGAVLGATTNGEVLAETGSVAVLAPTIGIVVIFSVILLARKTQLD